MQKDRYQQVCHISLETYSIQEQTVLEEDEYAQLYQAFLTDGFSSTKFQDFQVSRRRKRLSH